MKKEEIVKMYKKTGDTVECICTGKTYSISDFFKMVDNTALSKKDKEWIKSNYTDSPIRRSQESFSVEYIIQKYNIKFSDGVYFFGGSVKTIEEIYKIFWENEKLLPSETNSIIENVEKISENIDLQSGIFDIIKEKAIKGQSEYLKSLDILYPEINFRKIIYNIIVPKTRPLFHIFYDDGVGGTGKSTLLEVLTKIVGEKFVSNVLLDQFGNRFIFSNMLGKYLNIGDDNGKNDELQNVGTLKSIVTGNRVTIDRKNISPIEVRIFAKQLFATNILPYIDFTDGGIMRRLNIVNMNKVIPKSFKLCKLDEEEIGKIIYECLFAGDLEENNNELAITTSPIYRFYKEEEQKSYPAYQTFCSVNGFKAMNIINFEVKSRFIKDFIIREKKDIKELKVVQKTLPF